MSFFSQDDVLFILKLLDESEFDELQIESKDFKLIAKKKGGNLEVQKTGSPQLAPELPQKIIEDEITTPKFKETSFEVRKEGQISKPLIFDKDLVPIKAPMLGTFYRTPKPGAPPFVEIGSLVKEEDPVCVIEVMKCFNTVRAGVEGEIVQICAEHGQMVEFQQTLFLVKKIFDKKDSPKGSQA